MTEKYGIFNKLRHNYRKTGINEVSTFFSTAAGAAAAAALLDGAAAATGAAPPPPAPTFMIRSSMFLFSASLAKRLGQYDST